MALICLLLVILLLGSVGYAFGWILFKRIPDCRRQGLELVNQDLHLALEPGERIFRWLRLKRPERLRGLYRFHEVEILREQASSGGRFQTLEVLRMACPGPEGIYFELSRAAPHFFWLRTWNRGLTRIGDVAFDRHIALRTNAPEWVKEVLGEPMRARVLEVFGQHRAPGVLAWRDGELTYFEERLFWNARVARRFIAMVRLGSEFAIAVKVFT
ncbi:MAG TPA: hypothetical protein DIU37_03470 [Opitutae bacterium]|nr:hypothetical protein [Opitutae bacterium]|tara:strand:+ start:5163 stop:5804 length:642 start_codon:yes stop_codon:yes gene_type:complete